MKEVGALPDTNTMLYTYPEATSHDVRAQPIIRPECDHAQYKVISTHSKTRDYDWPKIAPRDNIFPTNYGPLLIVEIRLMASCSVM